MSVNNEIAANKIILNDEVIIDLTEDTANEDSVVEGFTFHKANGAKAVGKKNIKLQEIRVTPSDLIQYIDPDARHYGLSRVVVNGVTTESKSHTPTKEITIIKPSSVGSYLKQVTVDPIPEQYIVPAGTYVITENGTFDITAYKNVTINLIAPEWDGSITIEAIEP